MKRFIALLVCSVLILGMISASYAKLTSAQVERIDARLKKLSPVERNELKRVLNGKL